MTIVSWRSKGSSDVFTSLDPCIAGKDQDFVNSVLVRDKLKCVECGFQSRRSKQVKSGHMQLRPLDFNYDSRDLKNWITVCPYCHAFHRMTSAIDSEKYRVISAPWISQAELSKIVRPLIVILSDVDHLYYAEALQIYKTILSAESAVAALFPHIPATAATPADNLRRYFNLFDSVLTEQQYANRMIFASSLRIVPEKSHFIEESKYWNAAIFNQYPLSKWERLVSWKQDRESA